MSLKIGRNFDYEVFVRFHIINITPLYLNLIFFNFSFHLIYTQFYLINNFVNYISANVKYVFSVVIVMYMVTFHFKIIKYTNCQMCFPKLYYSKKTVNKLPTKLIN